MKNQNDKNDEVKLQVEEDEKHLLLEHDYDGVHELNHPLPKWWNFIFYVSIFFGVGYFSYYVLMGGPSHRDEYDSEMLRIKTIHDAYDKINSAYSQAKYDGYNKPENILRGHKVFTEYCIQCHLEGAIGDVGPNLTDDYWISGTGLAESNYEVVYKGKEDKGMPAWGEVLASEEIYLALVYVNSLRNTFNPKGKAPQGIKIVEEKPL